MPRIGHGEVATPQQLQQAEQDLAERAAEVEFGFAVASPAALQDFDFLFPELQNDPANLLAESADTVRHLKELGRTMHDPGGADPGDSTIPAIYTYFGQFIDHDITLEATSFTPDKLLDPNLTPLPLAQIRNELKNLRTATLELDSVYGPPAPRDPANPNKLKLGRVTKLGGTAPPTRRPPGKGDDNDLPREPRSPDIRHDRAALIGDPRNDENLIVAQLHLAFLKAHNQLAGQGHPFADARRLVRQHYQHLVLHDFLRRVVDPAVVDRILRDGNRFYDALAEPFFLPLEFTVAGYRFGHTMVRDAYDFNLNFSPASLGLLFTFTALSGELGDFDTLPDNWIIQWERFVGSATKNKARKLDTKLAQGLFHLQNLQGQEETPADAARLGVRNLLRGYGLRLPTGQALAHRMGLTPLTAQQLEAAAANPQQAQALGAGGFLDRTPLWYYLLAEAKHAAGGQRLGPVGSTLVAEVLIGLIRRSQDSILTAAGWMPSLPAAHPGRFELADLLRFAKVLGGGPPPPRTYTVKAGDSLSGIAQRQLGDASRWPEIFVLNRAKIRHRDRITVGQVFTLPGPTPLQPRPRLYTVRHGDTLSKIAQQQLGNPNRWPEIARLNRDIIPDPDHITPGQILVILPT